MRDLKMEEWLLVSGAQQNIAQPDDELQEVPASIIASVADFLTYVGGIYGGIQALNGVYQASKAGYNAYLNWRDGL